MIRDDRHAARHRRLEGDRTPQVAGPIKQLRTVLGQQRLVGRDDVLAAFQQLEHDRPGRLQAADQLSDHLNVRIFGHLPQVVCQYPSRQRDTANPVHVAIHDLFQLESPARVAADPCGVLQQDLGHACADRPHTDDGDLGPTRGLVLYRSSHGGAAFHNPVRAPSETVYRRTGDVAASS